MLAASDRGGSLNTPRLRGDAQSATQICQCDPMRMIVRRCQKLPGVSPPTGIQTWNRNSAEASQDPLQDVLPVAVLQNESQQTGALLILASKLQAGELNPLLGVEESLGTEKD